MRSWEALRPPSRPGYDRGMIGERFSISVGWTILHVIMSAGVGPMAGGSWRPDGSQVGRPWAVISQAHRPWTCTYRPQHGSIRSTYPIFEMRQYLHRSSSTISWCSISIMAHSAGLVWRR